MNDENSGVDRTPQQVRWLIVLALLVLGAGLYYYHSGETPAGAQGRGAKNGPIVVDVTTVQRRPIYNSITAVGSLLADESVTLRPQVAGVLEAASFKEGQAVEKGQLLIQLDDAIQDAELKQSQASLTLARANFARAQTLGRSGAGSRQSVEQSQSELAVSNANVASAQARFDKTHIVSPVSGRAGILQVNVGNAVAIGDALVTVETTDPMKLNFSVPEIFLRNLKQGMPVTMTVDALGKQTFDGSISVINPYADATTRSLQLRAKFDNKKDILRSGLFARVNIDLKDASPPLAIPETAMVPSGDQTFVFVIVDGKAMKKPVKIGLRHEGFAEVASGIAENDVIVVAGQMKLKDGAPVEIRQKPAPDATAPATPPQPLK